MFHSFVEVPPTIEQTLSNDVFSEAIGTDQESYTPAMIVWFAKRLLHLNQQVLESTHRPDTGNINEDSQEKKHPK